MLSRGKFKYLCSLYFTRVSLWPKHVTGKHRHTYPSVPVYHNDREYDFTPFIREVATKGYYDGVKKLDRDVDLEVFTHVSKAEGSTIVFNRPKERL